MKSIRTPLLVIIIVVLAVLLFQKCRETRNSDIPFNKDSAQVHHISLEDAVKLTSSFRRGRIELTRQLRDPSYLNKNFNLSFAEKINRDAIAELLNLKGAKGIRIYFGRDFARKDTDTTRIRMVLVAVDNQGKDILPDFPRQGTLKPGKVSYVMFFQGGDIPIDDRTQHCPEMCDLSSPLYQQQ